MVGMCLNEDGNNQMKIKKKKNIKKRNNERRGTKHDGKGGEGKVSRKLEPLSEQNNERVKEKEGQRHIVVAITSAISATQTIIELMFSDRFD